MARKEILAIWRANIGLWNPNTAFEGSMWAPYDTRIGIGWYSVDMAEVEKGRVVVGYHRSHVSPIGTSMLFYYIDTDVTLI